MVQSSALATPSLSAVAVSGTGIGVIPFRPWRCCCPHEEAAAYRSRRVTKRDQLKVVDTGATGKVARRSIWTSRVVKDGPAKICACKVDINQECVCEVDITQVDIYK